MTTLVADIGGTNTRVALARCGRLDENSIRRFRNADHATLYDVLKLYLAQAGSPEIAQACAAVAGPVRHGAGRLTNLDWDICEDRIGHVSGAGHVVLLNDLQAQGHALDALAPDALTPVREATRETGQTRLVIGIGTGFNAAAVHVTPSGVVVTAAEAGHASLPVSDAAGLDLAGFAAGPDGFAAVEDVLSGRGLENVHAWVTMRAGAPRRRDGHAILAASDTDPQAAEALRLFAGMLGTVAGDLALNHLPFGGIYLIGGIARAVTPHLVPAGFERAFRAKGRFAPLMDAFAVATVTDDFAALTGCAVRMQQVT